MAVAKDAAADVHVKMNSDTKNKLEKNAKENTRVRNELYEFCMKNIKQKGNAVFVFDDSIEDNSVIFDLNDISKTVKIK